MLFRATDSPSQQACHLVVSTSHGKHIQFEKNITLQHSFRIGDPRRTRQVVINVLNNGFKFTPEGGTVSIDVSENALKPEVVIVTITDTGTLLRSFEIV